ncbi:hypothetical protein [Mesorhizobium waimense]|nr:hypothetical protein [Mesorhizobium waimense]
MAKTTWSITASERARIFFIASTAAHMAQKVKTAYYKALEDEKDEAHAA